MRSFVGVSPSEAKEISTKIASALQATTVPAKKKQKSEPLIMEFSMETALTTFAKSWMKQVEVEYARGRERRLQDLLSLIGLGSRTPALCATPLVQLVHQIPTLQDLYDPFSRGGGSDMLLSLALSYLCGVFECMGLCFGFVRYPSGALSLCPFPRADPMVLDHHNVSRAWYIALLREWPDKSAQIVLMSESDVILLEHRLRDTCRVPPPREGSDILAGPMSSPESGGCRHKAVPAAPVTIARYYPERGSLAPAPPSLAPPQPRCRGDPHPL